MKVVAVTKKKASEAANMTCTLRGMGAPAGFAIRKPFPGFDRLEALTVPPYTLDGARLKT
ncbi:uncharacterized protein PY1_contig-01-364 [Novosphingobium sp. PY1]|nr:uncharacterized protein PY1_contig-01-364 [Novosphingobium sp. PY1]